MKSTGLFRDGRLRATSKPTIRYNGRYGFCVESDRTDSSESGSLCEHGDVADMKTLGRFQARLPHDLAKAIDLSSPIPGLSAIRKLPSGQRLP
jgi:hypothetical protein